MRLVTFASGSTGNCALLSAGDTHILIDAGISMRRIVHCLRRLGLEMRDVAGVLVTHSHRDHTAALQMLARHTETAVCAPRTVAGELRRTVFDIEKNLRVIPVGERFALGDLAVTAFRTSHDSEESVGFRFSGDAELGFCTDTGCVTPEMRACLPGVDAAVIEANHDEDMLLSGPYPWSLKRRVLSERGHLSNASAAELALYLCENGTGKLLLAHLSRKNNRPELAVNTVETYLAARGYFPQIQAAPMDGFCRIEAEGGERVCCPSVSSAAAV